MQEGFKLKKSDIILMIVIAAIALAATFVSYLGQKNGKYAVVTVDGEEYGRYVLSKDVSIEITNKDKKHNLMIIKNGSVKIKSADCPDNICVEHKKINKTNEVIACVPNNVLIEISTNGQ